MLRTSLIHLLMILVITGCHKAFTSANLSNSNQTTTSTPPPTPAPPPISTPSPTPAPASTGLHVQLGANGVNGHIVDASGNIVQMHGVNKMGTEYMCLSGGGFFDGPADQASINVMKSWKINVVRLPLNEDCWLGINGVPAATAGANYQKAVSDYTHLLISNGLYVILDLQWAAPGTTLANQLIPMADADHAPLFWSQVAKMFAGDTNVIFDLFNEPTVSDWSCWTIGGNCAQLNGKTYAVAGMATLLKAVRDTGAQNVVLMGGLNYSSDFTQWVASVKSMTNLPAPLNGLSIANVAASFHEYDSNTTVTGCTSVYVGYSTQFSCYSAATTVANAHLDTVFAAGFPVVMGEIGLTAYDTASAAPFSATQLQQMQTWMNNMMTYMERQGQGYLAWSFNNNGQPHLLQDFTNYTPTPYFGVTFKNHMMALP